MKMHYLEVPDRSFYVKTESILKIGIKFRYSKLTNA